MTSDAIKINGSPLYVVRDLCICCGISTVTHGVSLSHMVTQVSTLCNKASQPACIVYMAISHESGRGRGVTVSPTCACVTEPTTSFTSTNTSTTPGHHKMSPVPGETVTATESSVLQPADSLGGEAQHQRAGFWTAPVNTQNPACLSEQQLPEPLIT